MLKYNIIVKTETKNRSPKASSSKSFALILFNSNDNITYITLSITKVYILTQCLPNTKHVTSKEAFVDFPKPVIRPITTFLQCFDFHAFYICVTTDWFSLSTCSTHPPQHLHSCYFLIFFLIFLHCPRFCSVQQCCFHN